LPYCASPSEKHNLPQANPSLAEILGGHALRHSGYELFYGSKEPTVEECTTSELSKEEASRFVRAVEEQWFYQMYLDDLPVWGMVGEMLPKEEDEGKLIPYVYQDRHLAVAYNGDRIVKVDLTSDPGSLQEVKPNQTFKFRMTIEWTATDEPYHSRFDRYLDQQFFKHQIHWFSIFNSFMMVLFLTGLVSLIFLRTLKRDYARYARHASVEDMEEGETEQGEEDKLLEKESVTATHMAEDSGWKQVHGDVFRAPPNLPLLAALIGTGTQLIVLCLSVILFAVAGPLHGDVYESRGELLHATIGFYALSSVIAGYSSGSYFKKYSRSYNASTRSKPTPVASQEWQGVMALTAVLLPTLFVSILSILNFVAVYYGTIYQMPFFAIFKIFILWVFVSVPLSIIGTLMGRHSTPFSLIFKGKSKPRAAGTSDFPCRVNSIPRPIPEDTPWYGQPRFLIPLSGILPFGSIFIELYYILTSLWNYKYYHVYGFLLGMYTILGIVVSMTTIISTYFCLNAENYHWQWNAFFSGASTSIYVFLYGVYYFYFKTNMWGFLQTSFYFGYTALISLSLGCLCGTLGHASSSKFVRTIFQNVKVD